AITHDGRLYPVRFAEIKVADRWYTVLRQQPGDQWHAHHGGPRRDGTFPPSEPRGPGYASAGRRWADFTPQHAPRRSAYEPVPRPEWPPAPGPASHALLPAIVADLRLPLFPAYRDLIKDLEPGSRERNDRLLARALSVYLGEDGYPGPDRWEADARGNPRDRVTTDARTIITATHYVATRLPAASGPAY